MKVMSESADGKPMYVVYPSTAFKKELKKYKKQSERLNSIFVIVDILIRKGVKGITIYTQTTSTFGQVQRLLGVSYRT